jgi:hypothetical protein
MLLLCGEWGTTLYAIQNATSYLSWNNSPIVMQLSLRPFYKLIHCHFLFLKLFGKFATLYAVNKFVADCTWVWCLVSLLILFMFLEWLDYRVGPCFYFECNEGRRKLKLTHCKVTGWHKNTCVSFHRNTMQQNIFCHILSFIYFHITKTLENHDFMTLLSSSVLFLTQNDNTNSSDLYWSGT